MIRMATKSMTFLHHLAIVFSTQNGLCFHLRKGFLEGGKSSPKWGQAIIDTPLQRNVRSGFQQNTSRRLQSAAPAPPPPQIVPSYTHIHI